MLKPEGSLKDHNGDGSIDWKDLTVHSERIYRLEDSDGDGVADKRTLFAEGFNTEVTGIAAGILWHDAGCIAPSRRISGACGIPMTMAWRMNAKS
ncbi:DUF7133 domain-containing protein [Verrucomicrobium spinosum]|uniref:DUF7133 domain-containing protein n=1 Tax=Verrucomicrobium spinosum TaxID=2736 RepID=UPI003CCE2DD9